MSFIPNNHQRLDAELARERQKEIEQQAQRYAETHGDSPEARDAQGAFRRLTARVRALLHER